MKLGNIKRIIRESIDEFDWVEELPEYVLEGFYMTKPKKLVYSGLIGNLVFIKKIDGEYIDGLGEQYFVWINAVLMRNTPENESPTEQDFIQHIKHEMEHVKQDLTIIPKNWDEPQKISESSIIQLVSDNYFIKLS